MDKRKLSLQSSPAGDEGGRGSNWNSNATGAVTLEVLHQLAASYFADREGTLRRLHHLQIASTAIRVRESVVRWEKKTHTCCLKDSCVALPALTQGNGGMAPGWHSSWIPFNSGIIKNELFLEDKLFQTITCNIICFFDFRMCLHAL